MNQTHLKGHGKLNILIVTGVHGNELTPIACGLELAKDGNIEKSSYKNLIIIHAINMEGIRTMQRDHSVSATNDLNRQFGDSVSLDTLKTKLLNHIEFADVVIDIHSSPNCTEMILISQDLHANSYVEFARGLDIDYGVRYSNAKTIKQEAIKQGKIGFTVELNGMDSIDQKSSSKGTNLVTSIIENLETLKLVELEPSYPVMYEVKTFREGLITNKEYVFIPGNSINNGDELFNIYDIGNPNPVYNLVSYDGPNGCVLNVTNNDYVLPGEVIMLIQPH